jgi:hypothetical protein
MYTINLPVSKEFFEQIKNGAVSNDLTEGEYVSYLINLAFTIADLVKFEESLFPSNKHIHLTEKQTTKLKIINGGRHV